MNYYLLVQTARAFSSSTLISGLVTDHQNGRLAFRRRYQFKFPVFIGNNTLISLHDADGHTVKRSFIPRIIYQSADREFPRAWEKTVRSTGK